MADPGIPLRDVVDQLRAELFEMTLSAKGEDLTFAVESVDVELQVAVTKGTEAGAKAKFWVFAEVGAKGTYAAERTQKVTLTLKPAHQGRETESVKIGRRKK